MVGDAISHTFGRNLSVVEIDIHRTIDSSSIEMDLFEIAFHTWKFKKKIYFLRVILKCSSVKELHFLLVHIDIKRNIA